MAADEPTTEAIDKLFLELSQFTGATTARELRLRRLCALAQQAMEITGIWLNTHAVYRLLPPEDGEVAAHVNRLANIGRRIADELSTPQPHSRPAAGEEE